MASIRKRNGKWQVQVRRKGSAPISKSFVEKADANRWARSMETQADRAQLPDMRVLQTVTLGELVERYRDTITPRHRGHKDETFVLNAFLRNEQELCSKPLSHLSQREFAAYRDRRLGTVSAATVRRQLVPLKHMFKIAQREWGIPVENYVKGITLENSDNKRNRRLREGELDRLLTECREFLPLYRIILLAIETGMRRGEILNVRYRDIDWNEPSLHIPASKTGRSRTIPLSPKALEQLTYRTPPAMPHGVREGDRVFPFEANRIKHAWIGVCKRAGVEGLRFHDLRHEAISRFFEAGLSVPDVALISGHADLRMLGRYTHPQRKAILAKLAA